MATIGSLFLDPPATSFVGVLETALAPQTYATTVTVPAGTTTAKTWLVVPETSALPASVPAVGAAWSGVGWQSGAGDPLPAGTLNAGTYTVTAILGVLPGAAPSATVTLVAVLYFNGAELGRATVVNGQVLTNTGTTTSYVLRSATISTTDVAMPSAGSVFQVAYYLTATSISGATLVVPTGQNESHVDPPSPTYTPYAVRALGSAAVAGSATARANASAAGSLTFSGAASGIAVGVASGALSAGAGTVATIYGAPSGSVAAMGSVTPTILARPSGLGSATAAASAVALVPGPTTLPALNLQSVRTGTTAELHPSLTPASSATTVTLPAATSNASTYQLSPEQNVTASTTVPAVGAAWNGVGWTMSLLAMPPGAYSGGVVALPLTISGPLAFYVSSLLAVLYLDGAEIGRTTVYSATNAPTTPTVVTGGVAVPASVMTGPRHVLQLALYLTANSVPGGAFDLATGSTSSQVVAPSPTYVPAVDPAGAATASGLVTTGPVTVASGLAALSGSATGAAPATPSGAATIAANVAPTASASATGSSALAGLATASSGYTATGSATATGQTTATASPTVAGVATVRGLASPTTTSSASGTAQALGTTTATARAAAAGLSTATAFIGSAATGSSTAQASATGQAAPSGTSVLICAVTITGSATALIVRATGSSVLSGGSAATASTAAAGALALLGIATPPLDPRVALPVLAASSRVAAGVLVTATTGRASTTPTTGQATTSPVLGGVLVH